jgi:hypothetical protein
MRWKGAKTESGVVAASEPLEKVIVAESAHKNAPERTTEQPKKRTAWAGKTAEEFVAKLPANGKAAATPETKQPKSGAVKPPVEQPQPGEIQMDPWEEKCVLEFGGKIVSDGRRRVPSWKRLSWQQRYEMLAGDRERNTGTEWA